ncbi:DUF3137 domain-containing protein [bacterium]|nr:DUF3137 domain-containing protein [bacterium]
MSAIISKSEFCKSLEQTIDFQRFEAERKSKIINMLGFEIILIFFLYFGFYLLKFLLEFQQNINPNFYTIINLCAVIFGLIYLLAIISFIGIPFWFNKEYKEEIKKSCKTQIKDSFDISFSKKGFTKSMLELSRLFGDFEKIEYDDCFRGIYKDTGYTVAETSLIATRNYGKNKNEFTIFKGVIISFNFNKQINAETIVISKNDYSVLGAFNICDFMLFALAPLFLIVPIILIDLNYWLSHPFWTFYILTFPAAICLIISITGNLANFLKTNQNWERVHLEDVNFEKKFKIFSKNQVEARYLVTTSFMERLQNIKTAFGTRNIKCSFFDDKIIFAIYTEKDLFELGNLYKPFGKDIQGFYNQIISIYNMIDHFKLNEKIGL